MNTDNGWKPWREILTEGTPGRIRAVDLYRYWGAEFVPDRQWSVGDGGKRYEVPEDRHASFFLPMRLLERID